MNKIYTVFFLLLLSFVSCKSDDKKTITLADENERKVITKSENINSVLDNYDLDVPAKVITYSPDLKELSGITLNQDGSFFAICDELGVIYEIDTNGNVIKKFFPGSVVVLEGDFEDLTFINGKIYMLKSNGSIFEFPEAENERFIEFIKYETPLIGENDVEGICFDPETNTLLLACKGSSGTGRKDEKAVYSFSLNDKKIIKNPRFILPLDVIDKKEFSPSGIARHPNTGNFLIISAQGNLIIEITKDGKFINSKKLPTDIHLQPEGIAIDNEQNLYISNEGKDKRPSIIKYTIKK